MLKRLLIRNYAIIEKVDIHFSEGLNIITGETGAGKSILLGALGLIMGKRADTKTLFDKDRKCIIEGVFQLPKGFESFFESNDMDYEKETIIRREITPSGKSRAFVNDTPANLNLLRKLCSALVDLHQQFDTLDIHNVSFQLNIIDALAGQKETVASYRKEYSAYARQKKLLEQWVRESQEAHKEIDFLNFQLKEFNEAALTAGEDIDAEEDLKTLSHAEDIKRILGGINRQLTEDENSLVSQLHSMAYEMGDISKFSGDLENLKERFDGLILELEDISGEMERVGKDTEHDPERIREIRERLDIIYRLQNKHQVTDVEELLNIQTDIENKLDSFGDLSGKIEELEAKMLKMESSLMKKALGISKQRKKIMPSLEKNTASDLAQLSMPFAQLKVDMDSGNELTPDGIDRIEFLFSANKGSRLESIKDVASGGELSRLTLCIKSQVAGALALPTMIFDEIDTGVSGDVALKMGQILKDLAQGHQIITITHTPQIAIQADSHFFVYKDHEGSRTTTDVRLLAADERVKEVATMLSGSPPSSSAMDNAKELLGV